MVISMNASDFKGKLAVFDIARIVAALMVFVVHLFMFVPAPAKLSEIILNGAYGVSIFFVISGYLIMESIDRSRNLKEYYVKRVLRIIPSYYAILIVGIVVWDLWLGQMPYEKFGWLRYFLCLNTFIPSGDYYKWNDLWGLWTISGFMFFYLIAPLFKKWIKNFRQAAAWLVAVVAGSYVFLILMNKVLVAAGYTPRYAESLSADSPIFNLNVFFFGIALWYAVKEEKLREYLQVVTIILAAFIFVNKTNRVTYGAITSILVVIFAGIKIQSKGLLRVVETGSRYSFSVYLVHLMVMGILDMWNLSIPVYILLSVVGTAVCAVALYHLVEKPAAKLLKKRL